MFRAFLLLVAVVAGVLGYAVLSDPIKHDFETACISAAREAPLVGGIADEAQNRVRWCGCMGTELSKEVGLSDGIEQFFSRWDMRQAGRWEDVFGYFGVSEGANASFVCGQQPYFGKRWW